MGDKAFCDGIEAMLIVVARLHSLGRSFAVTGNAVVAEKLTDMADELLKAKVKIQDGREAKIPS